MNELQEILTARGFDSRPAQNRLYRHLTSIEEDGAIREHGGVIAQAGTGTGKSLGILAAAAHHVRASGQQAIIVTPTLTLMNQYRDGDTPWAVKAFEDLEFAEIRGMAHYQCEVSKQIQESLDFEYTGGCMGLDAGCTQTGWEGHDDSCLDEDCKEVHDNRWECGYRLARWEAARASVVVTNADMLIVNDRVLAGLDKNFLSLEGSLFVDEAHTLEQKMRDYASRSLFHGSVKRFSFADDSGPRLARWIEHQDRNLALKDFRGFPAADLERIARASMPAQQPGDGLTKQRETQESCQRILQYMSDPHDSAVLHVGGGSLKVDWINVAKSSGELISQRDFGLVSATVPRTMGATLGVPEAPFIDVGHPFDYANQAWIGFSPYGGSFRDAQSTTNFDQRTTEVMDLIRRAKGGALVLFSSFKDMETVAERLKPQISDMGLRFLMQERDMEAADRQRLADEFRSDGNAVLFGSESFATGFDVPKVGDHDPLRLVVVWKLPFAAMDPVSSAIRSNSYQRYDDMMKVRAVQAIGRLIRTDQDRGIVWIADQRGRRLLDGTDPLTAHLLEFNRL